MRENNNCGNNHFPPKNINFVGVIGPTGPTGPTGPAGGATGPTGPTERLFKSSNKIIIDSS